jgi:UrcA family protein
LARKLNWGVCTAQLVHKEIQVKIFRALIPTVLIGSAALTLSTQVLAADAAAGGTFEVPSRTISLKDLDLGEPGHLPIMYARVQQAALAVCDSTVRAERRLHRRVPAGWRDQCVRSAVDEAVRSVDDQRLTALHGRNAGLMADEK